MVAVAAITGKPPRLVWHTETDLGQPHPQLVILPGGFTFGDYLREGAIAARSPIMDAVLEHSWRGGFILGICNGFQILLEMGLLPGVLLHNKSMRFVCTEVSVALHPSPVAHVMLGSLKEDKPLALPIAHAAGNYYTDDETLARLTGNGQVALTYLGDNPNGSLADIAGILSDNGRVLGLMPHPERKIDAIHGGNDGRLLLKSVIEAAA